MNFKKCFASILAIGTISAVMAVPSAYAAMKGRVICHHGVISARKATYGSMDSTKLENSMGINGWLKITAGQMTPGTYNLPMTSNTNCNVHAYVVEVNKTKGSSSFNYYVDGTKVHTSTAPWNFDFR